jgi:integrase
VITPGVFRTLCMAALKTGMRQGELLALTWADVDLGEAVARVNKNWTDGILKTPKTHEARDVDLTTDVVELLGRWWGECDRPGNDALVFPGGGKDGYIPGSNVVCRSLYRAMRDAGIPRENGGGEKRTFHSFRHSYAKFALESELPLFWLSRQLGLPLRG